MELTRISSKRQFSRAVVTGGAGFLGSHLCEALLMSGTEVVCVDDFSTGSRNTIAHLYGDPRFTVIEVDVSEFLDVAGTVDLVLHFASPASPSQYARMPVHTLRAGSSGTYNALRLAQTKGARFIVASSSEVYGDPIQHPQTEEYRGNVNPIGPRSMYDEAKRFSEALTSAFGRLGTVNFGIARIFNTYGPRLRPYDGRAIPNFIRQALTGEPLTIAGDGRQTRSLCYVDDLVRGILALAYSDYPGPFNLGNPSEITIHELALLVLELTGSSSTVRFIDAALDDPRRRCPDISMAKEQLCWRPSIGLEEGLRRTIEWSSVNGIHATIDHGESAPRIAAIDVGQADVSVG